MTLKHEVLNGRALLAFLQSLNEEQLNAPVMVSSEKPEDTYFASQVSSVAGKIFVHVPTLSARQQYGPFVDRKSGGAARHPIVEMTNQLNRMVSEARSRDGFWGASAASKDGYVPPVDADDLKRVFTMQGNVHKYRQGPGAISLDVF